MQFVSAARPLIVGDLVLICRHKIWVRGAFAVFAGIVVAVVVIVVHLKCLHRSFAMVLCWIITAAAYIAVGTVYVLIITRFVEFSVRIPSEKVLGYC